MTNKIKPTILLSLIFIFGCGSGGTTTTPTTTTPVSTVLSATDVTATANKIQLVTQTTIGFGLTVLGGKDAAEAKLIATQIQTIVSGSILPYLNGSQGVSTAVIDTALKENFVNLPVGAQSMISLAAALLDQYLPAPGANTFLTPQELAYAKAFFQGLSDGAGQYLGNKAAPSVELSKVNLPQAPGNWLNFSKK